MWSNWPRHPREFWNLQHNSFFLVIYCTLPLDSFPNHSWYRLSSDYLLRSITPPLQFLDAFQKSADCSPWGVGGTIVCHPQFSLAFFLPLLLRADNLWPMSFPSNDNLIRIDSHCYCYVNFSGNATHSVHWLTRTFLFNSSPTGCQINIKKRSLV